MLGTVRFYRDGRFGFIVPDEAGADIFVGSRAVGRAGLKGLVEGDRVSFDIVIGSRGNEATDIKRLKS
jgi:cold shock protein